MKYRLLPYIYTYAREAYETGLPIMRPMFMEYPADLETVSTDAQFMFGSELLVAPVVKKGATNKNVYLPEGTWIDYNDKRTEYSGEQWTTANAPLNTIPMFVRKGSIIPQMPVMNYTDEKAVYPITFEVFPAAVGGETSFPCMKMQELIWGISVGNLYVLLYLAGQRKRDMCSKSGKGRERSMPFRENAT